LKSTEETVTACIICVGTEITEGFISDKHGRYISSVLREIGIHVKKIVLLPDEKEIFKGELEEAISLFNLVFITGGLGPTSDDITREVIAEVKDVPLLFEDKIWELLLKRFGERKPSPSNRKQAEIPRGFSWFENPNGTAPGLWGWVSDTLVIALPGPPLELIPMVENDALPVVKDVFGIRLGSAFRATSFLIPESVLEDVLAECAGGLSWGTRVEEYRIVFSIIDGKADERREVFKRVEEKLGSFYVREGDVDPAKVLFDTLKREKKMLAVVESCTGGLVGKLITDIPGSSQIFWGSLVTYANGAKAFLGVVPEVLQKYGAVSAEAVRQMAGAALERSGVDVALAISGIAGPEGGSEEKPVGTVWISVIKDKVEFTRKFLFRGDRGRIRRRAAVTAILLADTLITDKESLDRKVNWEYI